MPIYENEKRVTLVKNLLEKTNQISQKNKQQIEEIKKKMYAIK